MKKYKYLIIFLIVFLIPNFAYASCTEEEIQYFRQIEENYKIESSIDKETGLYTLVLRNQEPGTYTYTIKGTDYNFLCEISENADTVCENVLPGGYRINIVGNTKTCDDILKRAYLSLKPYNKYSEDPLCDDIKEFSLCQETYDKEIDYETFALRVNAYKESKTKESETKSNNTFDINRIKEYIENNLFQVIVIAVFITLVIVTLTMTIITAKKSRRLE